MNTGYCYDPLFLEHTCAGHPESSERLGTNPQEQLAGDGLLDRMVASRQRMPLAGPAGPGA